MESFLAKRKKILIIEDEVDLCLLLKGYFVGKNYEAFVSYSLTEGLEILKLLKPDLLFLDNNLPDGIGWDYAPQIAIDYPSTFIVLISAFNPVVPNMPDNANFIAIEKPISFSDLDSRFR